MNKLPQETRTEGPREGLRGYEAMDSGLENYGQSRVVGGGCGLGINGLVFPSQLSAGISSGDSVLAGPQL